MKKERRKRAANKMYYNLGRKFQSGCVGFLLGLSFLSTDLPATNVEAAYQASPTSLTELSPQIENGEVTEAHVVKFANKDWYVIGYEGVADEYSEGDTKITLFSKDTLLSNVVFASNSNNAYSTSDIKSTLDAYVADTDNFTSKEQAVIVTRRLEGGYFIGDYGSDCVAGDPVDAKLWPLSAYEATIISNDLRKASNDWWLRSPGYSMDLSSFVADQGKIYFECGMGVLQGYSVRPALQLNLSLVTLKPESDTIYLEPKESQTITAPDIQVTCGETDKLVIATVDGNGTISYAVKDGSEEYIDVDATTGDLTIKKAGTAFVIVTADETATHAKATKEVTVTITDERVKENTIALYRLYNSYTKEHLYTDSTNERDVLSKSGWIYEGIAWYAPEKSNTPVYRFYNPVLRDHHYTTDKHEKDVLSKKYGWKYEGIGWYSDDNKTVPIYRVFCPFITSGSHHFTVGKNEVKHLISVGWIDEKIGWYGVKEK